MWRLGYLRGSRRVRGWVRLPFLTVLMCEIGTRGREASVEGYAVDGLAASGEPAGPAAGRGLAELEAAGNAVAPGLGPLVVRVAVMYEGAAGAVLLDDMERLAVEESRKIGLGALQLAMDAQADAEMPLPGLTGQDGERRGCRERSATTVVTMLGRVRVRRVAYRSRKKGVADLHWRDAVLNLPPCGHSWQLQRFAEMACRSGSFQDGHDLVLAATGVSTGKRQLEEIVARAAADAEEFAAGRRAGRARHRRPGRGGTAGRAGDVRGRQGRVDAAGRAARGDRPEGRETGQERGQTARERGKAGEEADGRDRRGVRFPAAGRAGPHPAGHHGPPGRAAAPHPAGPEQVVHLRHHRYLRRGHRPGHGRSRPGATRNCSGTGSPSSTATHTRSSASRRKPRTGARRSPSSSTSST